MRLWMRDRFSVRITRSARASRPSIITTDIFFPFQFPNIVSVTDILGYWAHHFDNSNFMTTLRAFCQRLWYRIWWLAVVTCRIRMEYTLNEELSWILPWPRSLLPLTRLSSRSRPWKESGQLSLGFSSGDHRRSRRSTCHMRKPG